MFCYSKQVCFLVSFLEDLKWFFFLCGSGVFCPVFHWDFSLILISFRNGVGRGRVNIEWNSHSLTQILLVIIPHLKAHTLKESFQKWISSWQPKTGKGLGWEMWVFFSIPILYIQVEVSFASAALGAFLFGVLGPRWLLRGPSSPLVPQQYTRTAQTYVA